MLCLSSTVTGWKKRDPFRGSCRSIQVDNVNHLVVVCLWPGPSSVFFSTTPMLSGNMYASVSPSGGRQTALMAALQVPIRGKSGGTFRYLLTAEWIRSPPIKSATVVMTSAIAIAENPTRDPSFPGSRTFAAPDSYTVVCTMKIDWETNQCSITKKTVRGMEYANGIDNMYEDLCKPWGEDTRSGFFSLISNS